MTDEIYNIQLYRDGNQWCALIGENIQDGTCGFGDSVKQSLKELADELYSQGVW